MLFFNKKLIEFYDTIRDPIKIYFMDRMQNVIINFNKSTEKTHTEKYREKQKLKNSLKGSLPLKLLNKNPGKKIRLYEYRKM